MVYRIFVRHGSGILKKWGIYMKHFSIAIDGPSGAGKSTMAKMLAKELRFIYVDTGAMYRGVGLYIYNNGINSKDRETIIEQLPNISVKIVYADNEQRVLLNGEDVSGLIRNEKIGRYASDCSAIKEVREHLLSLQRDMGKSNDIIMDGRDIGTVVLPCATLKIFLVADLRDRAQRRYDEMRLKGMECTYEEILKQMAERDYNDMSRAVAPLRAAEDAITVDTTGISIDEVYNMLLRLVKERLNNVL